MHGHCMFSICTVYKMCMYSVLTENVTVLVHTWDTVETDPSLLPASFEGPGCDSQSGVGRLRDTGMRMIVNGRKRRRNRRRRQRRRRANTRSRNVFIAQSYLRGDPGTRVSYVSRTHIYRVIFLRLVFIHVFSAVLHVCSHIFYYVVFIY